MLLTGLPFIFAGYASLTLIVASFIHLFKCSGRSKIEKFCWSIALLLGNTLVAPIYYWAAWSKPVKSASSE